MGRSLLVIVVLLAGCTRPNPAFDDTGGSEEVAEGSDELAEAEESDQSEGEGESGSESGEADLPMPACEYQPSAGLDLKFGDPNHFGGTCPNSVDVWVKAIELGGGMLTVETCDPNCLQCAGPHPLSAYPLSITDHLPVDPACLHLQANVSLGPAPDVCQWGALSVYDAVNGTPYVIATAHASEPTPMGLETLGGLIPEPVKIANCDCDEVGQGHDCCYQAESPPEFLAFPWGDEYLLPGDYAMIMLANQAGADHYFHVYQAERLNLCENSERSLSWAVVAKF